MSTFFIANTPADEHDKVNVRCCYCDVHMTNVHETSDPYPVSEHDETRCCEACYRNVVIIIKTEMMLIRRNSQNRNYSEGLEGSRAASTSLTNNNTL